MPALWPTSLPNVQLIEGLQETAPSRMVRSQMDVGPVKSRPRFTAGIRTFVVFTGDLTSQDVDDLLTFHRVTCRGGQDPFEWIHPRTGDPHTVYRFIEPPEIIPLGSDTWKARLSLEVLPNYDVAVFPDTVPLPPFPPDPPPPPPPPPPVTGPKFGLIGVWVFDDESGGPGKVANLVTLDPREAAVITGTSTVSGGYLHVEGGSDGAIVEALLTTPLRPTSMTFITQCKFLADGSGINPIGIIARATTNVGVESVWSIERPAKDSFTMLNDAIQWRVRTAGLVRTGIVNPPLDYQQETRFVFGISYDFAAKRGRAYVNGLSVGEMPPVTSLVWDDTSKIMFGRVDFLTYWNAFVGIYWGYYWNRALTDAEHAQVAVNPQIIFPLP